MFGSCLVFGLQMCVRCCQPFVTEVASGVSDVDPNGHVMRLSFVGCCQPFVAEAASFFGVRGLVFSLSFVVSEIDHCLLVGIHQTFGF